MTVINSEIEFSIFCNNCFLISTFSIMASIIKSDFETDFERFVEVDILDNILSTKFFCF